MEKRLFLLGTPVVSGRLLFFFLFYFMMGQKAGQLSFIVDCWLQINCDWVLVGVIQGRWATGSLLKKTPGKSWDKNPPSLCPKIIKIYLPICVLSIIGPWPSLQTQPDYEIFKI